MDFVGYDYKEFYLITDSYTMTTKFDTDVYLSSIKFFRRDKAEEFVSKIVKEIDEYGLAFPFITTERSLNVITKENSSHIKISDLTDGGVQVYIGEVTHWDNTRMRSWGEINVERMTVENDVSNIVYSGVLNGKQFRKEYIYVRNRK